MFYSERKPWKITFVFRTFSAWSYYHQSFVSHCPSKSYCWRSHSVFPEENRGSHIHHLNDPVSVLHVARFMLWLLFYSWSFFCFLTAEIRKACWSLMLSQPQFLPFLSLLFPISGYTKIVQQKGRPLMRGLVRCSEYSSTAWVASSIIRGSSCWQMALLLHCVELGSSCLWTFISHPGTAFLSFLSTVGQLPS